MGISYVLRATLCTRPRHVSGGATAWFRRSSSPLLMVATAPIDLVRHDLHSAWPIYRPISPLAHTVEDRGLTMEVVRRTTALGPGDEIVSRIKLESQCIHPIKINRFEISLTEVFSYSHAELPTMSALGKSLSASDVSGNISNSLSRLRSKKESTKGSDGIDRKIHSVVDVHAKVQQTLLHKNCLSFDVRGTFPQTHCKVTVLTAQHISLHYLMKIRVVFEATGKHSDKKKLPTELVISDL